MKKTLWLKSAARKTDSICKLIPKVDILQLMHTEIKRE